MESVAIHIHTLQAEKVIQKQWYDSDIANRWISKMRSQVLLDYAMQGGRRLIQWVTGVKLHSSAEYIDLGTNIA